MKVIGVIPARLGSTRLKEKALLPIAGKPMIQWIYENCTKAKTLSEVILATDHALIFEVAQKFGAKVLMTSPAHLSGSDRVAEVAQALSADIVVNIQGDEPLMEAETIDKVVHALKESDSASMSSAMTPFETAEEFLKPQNVKVLVNHLSEAIYFSRLPLANEYLCQRHLGIYAFRKEKLIEFSHTKQTALEKAESLEQLRALHLGWKIQMALVQSRSIGVDTQEDYLKICKFLEK